MFTLHFQFKSLLLVSVLPALSLACNHPSTGGTSDGTGNNGAGGSSAGHSGSGGTNGSAGANGRAGNGAGGSSTASDGGADAVSSTGGSGPTRGPTPPAPGMKFPFPQNRQSANCVYPTGYTNDVVVAAYNKWKADTVTNMGAGGFRRVKRTQSDFTGTGGLALESTVSEGIGYGMLIAVYMNDQALFDDLWKYEQLWPNDKTGLMDWYISADGSMRLGTGPATDADEDMAFALVMADKQWGGYSTTAMNMLMTVSTNDFATDGTIKGGDKYANAVNPSYLAPAFYKVFAAYSGDTRWTTILNKSYMLLASAQNATTGLVPDWSMGPGTNASYGYDATRTPFRVALDVCWNGDANAMAFSQKIGAFFAGIGVANIGDQYTVATGAKTSPNNNSTFIGPAGAAGMASNQAKLVADAYARVAADAKAANTNYYDRSWALFTTLLMTGNFLNFQSP
jgi:endo-1,4-beta-D-glucanase Y